MQGPQLRPPLRDGPRLRPHLHPGHQLGAADGDALPHRLVPLPAIRHSGTGIDHSTYEARLDVYDRLLNLILLDPTSSLLVIMFFGGNCLQDKLAVSRSNSGVVQATSHSSG